MDPFPMHFGLPTNTAPLSLLHSAIKPHPFFNHLLLFYQILLPTITPLGAVVCLIQEKEVIFEVFDDMPVRKMVNHIPPSPVKQVNLEEESLMKQGILTILRSDCETSKSGSIRRTLSADMSSKKWLHQNGFLSPIKKNVSSEALLHPSSSSESEEDEYEHEQTPNQDDVWRSIQAQKERNQIPDQKQVWGSILTQKSENTTLPPPYVHPLVKKKSVAALNGKSLEICTEGLGSETGSDSFSSYSCSEASEQDKEERQSVVGTETEDFTKDANHVHVPDFHVAKYRKSPARPFPPPLPSISDGVSLHMQSHRENGRLVLEAVSVPPRNYFHAQRQDGRLLLTLIHAPPAATISVDENEEQFEKVFDDMEEVDQQPPEVEAVVVEEKGEEHVPESVHNGMVMNAHKSGLVMKKLVGNINPTWSKKDKSEVVDQEEFTIPQSLPPRVVRFAPAAPPSAAASLNVYEYFWRSKTAGFLNPMITNKMNGTNKYHENQDLVLMRANKTEQFVPYFRGCKEARRSLPIPEPSCWIATS